MDSFDVFLMFAGLQCHTVGLRTDRVGEELLDGGIRAQQRPGS